MPGNRLGDVSAVRHYFSYRNIADKILNVMPYATRQSVIDFPKRKLTVKNNGAKSLGNIKQSTPSPAKTTPLSSSVRKAFHSSTCGSIIGREKELNRLEDFLLSHSQSQKSGSIYISGLPGTGKTASVEYIIRQHELHKKYQIVKINCTAFNSSKSVFKRIQEALKLKLIRKTEQDSISAIENYLVRKHKMILLILDEIDQLESKSQSVLYKIFEWPSWTNSKLVLVGIANAMDLTDRILPRLCAKMELKPVLLHFAPYTKEEITEILKNRLNEVGADKIFAPGAIELISAKVAGTSGDVRRALDLGKRVIEIAEKKNKAEILSVTKSPEKKTGSIVRSPQKNLKRKMEETSSSKKLDFESLIDKIVDEVNEPPKNNISSLEASPRKLLRSGNNSERVCLSEITPQKYNSLTGVSPRNKGLRATPKKLEGLCDGKSLAGEDLLKNLGEENLTEIKSPLKIVSERQLRSSPRKLQFDVDSRDVLSVVKTCNGSLKNFKASEESTFPLHQKLLICTLLLIMKKGKKKDLNVGKLHCVYSKICAKRGITAVDKSGFLFLCRQVEMTGVLQIGKGLGTLAKVTLQWDESEITNSLKDLNMLSSILNDTSCLS